MLPNIANNKKSSKISILANASEYCHLLTDVDSKIYLERKQELKRNSLLKNKLVRLCTDIYLSDCV